MVLAQKDLKRQKSKTKIQSNLLDIFSKITLEDVYKFISESYLLIKDQKDLIKSSFYKAGYNCKEKEEDLTMQLEELKIEDEPFDDDLLE